MKRRQRRIKMGDPKIIALSGAHGTGKTTAVFELAAELKKSQLSEVCIIPEIARICPYPIFSKDTISSKEAQIWMFSAQMQAEMDASRRYDIVISDRTIVDVIAYAAAAGMYDLAFAMKAMAKNYAKSAYKEVFFRSIVDYDFQVDDGSREMGHALRKEVELALLSLYSELGIQLNYGKG